MEDFTDLLRQHKYRVTTPRRVVFEALWRTTQPLSLSEISQRCPMVDRASVYRAIEVCLAIGAVKVVHVGWKKRYELSDLFRPHHHHFHCVLCQRIIAIADEELEQMITAIAHKHQFSPLAHQFEVDGICQHCRSRSNSRQE